jgi:hypothetical protein
MNELYPRIRTASISVTFVAKRGAAVTPGAFRGVNATVANLKPYPRFDPIRDLALHTSRYGKTYSLVHRTRRQHERRFCPVTHSELVEDMTRVVVDRFRADEELGGYFLVGFPL